MCAHNPINQTGVTFPFEKLLAMTCVPNWHNKHTHVHALDCVGCPSDDTWVAILSLLGFFFSFLLGTPWETGNQYSAMGHLL